MVAGGLVWLMVSESRALARSNKQLADSAAPRDDSAQTFAQISDALTVAKKDHKQVLLQFGGHGCTWCHLLETLFKTDQRIAGELEKDFVVVLVDVSSNENNGNNKGVRDKYGNPDRDGVPVTVFLDSDGKQLLAENIAFADKEAQKHKIARVDPDKVLAFLKKVAGKST